MTSHDKFTFKDTIPSLIATTFFILQLIYGFFFATNDQNTPVAYFGIGTFLLSGFFGIAPIIMFPRKGRVEKGKSFVYTTKIVNTGIYAIMRHPQYSSFMLWAIGAMLLFQHPIIILLGIPVILFTYYDMIQEEKDNITKFGEAYVTYMNTVPRVNFILGLLRIITKKTIKKT